MTNETTRLSELVANVGIVCKRGPRKPYHSQDDWQKSANGWRVRLAYQGRAMTLDFWQGSAHVTEPDAQGVLYCLLSDASLCADGFEDFCSNVGADENSRKALADYHACVNQTKRLEKLLGPDYDTFFESDQD